MNNKKILIIDDDPIVLFMHEAILEDMVTSTQVISFKNGALAKDYILAHPNDELLLLLDINMPVMSGWDLLDFLFEAKLNTNISVLMVTSSVNDSDRIKALKYPMVRGMLIKPLSAELIHEKGEWIKSFLI